MQAPRLSKSRDLSLIDVSPPFSNFSYVDLEYPKSPAIRRLFSQARSIAGQNPQTLITETLSPEGLVADENAEIESLFPARYTMRCLRRISFWTCPKSKMNKGQHRSRDLTGYAVLKLDELQTPCGLRLRWHIFESVFRKYPHEHNYMPRPRDFRVQVGAREFRVPGVLYCQQNGLNKACAQVALRSLLVQQVIDTDIPYSRINEIARAVQSGFRPRKGLNSMQIGYVLDELRIPYTPIDYTVDGSLRRDFRYQRFLYAGIESGDGALLGFEFKGQGAHGERHIIPFFGHTFNKDTWVPYAEKDYFHVGEKTRYITSEAWTSSYIGHDDNFGSNFCVPRLYVEPSRVQYVAVIHRQGFTGSGVEAEAIAIEYLYSLLPEIASLGGRWLMRLIDYVQRQKVVIRAIPITRSEYIDHLAASRDWRFKEEHKYIRDALATTLPDHFWMIEVSVPELFAANKRKIGCILLKGDRPFGTTLDFSSFLLARMPGYYLFFRQVGEDGQPQFAARASNLRSHVDVLQR